MREEGAGDLLGRMLDAAIAAADPVWAPETPNPR